MNLFTGSFVHAVDGKNRVSVPRKIVETLRELGSPDEVVITVGLDRCQAPPPPNPPTDFLPEDNLLLRPL